MTNNDAFKSLKRHLIRLNTVVSELDSLEDFQDVNYSEISTDIKALTIMLEQRREILQKRGRTQMTEKRFIPIFDGTDKRVVGAKDNGKIISFMDMFDLLNDLSDANEQLKIRNKGKQAFINKQYKIIKLLYNQCKDFKEILDDSNITYPIDERLEKFFEEGVKL